MMTRTAALLLFALLAPAARADTVIFKTGLQLEGRVVPPREGDKTLRIVVGGEENSSITVRTDTIERIEYDYDSQLAALPGDAYLKHYELGLWCMERSLFDEAAERLRYAEGREGVPAEVHFYLGRTYEKIDPPQYAAAAKQYEDFLATPPAEPLLSQAQEALARVKKLVPAEPVTGPAPSGGAEGAEAEAWAAQNWGNTAAVSVKPMQSDPGNKVLVIEYKDVDAHGKKLAGDQRKVPVRLTLNRDLSRSPILTFDAYNFDSKPIEITVALQTGQQYEWFESANVAVPPRAWKLGIRLDLSRKIWKSEASGWGFTTEVKNLELARNMIVVVYNGDRTGTLLVDAIQFQAAP